MPSGHMARQNVDTHQESYVPTTIKAAQLAQLKAKRDATIIGSTVSGKKVEVDTGRDLHVQSLLDVDNFKEHSKSAGFSFSSKPNFKDPTGSISASVGRIDSKWKSVTHQAGIYAGEDGYDKIYNSIGLVPNIGVGSKGKASSTTQSAISDDILTVDSKEIDTKTINTNTENTLHQLDKIFDKKKIEERQELARLFSKNAFEQLHNWQPTTKDGKVVKSIAHGVVGGKSSNSGAATTSYATKWNEGLFHVDRVDLDGISEDNKDLALADLNYDVAQSNRYNINKLREKKKYIRKEHLYSESKGIGAGITDVVGIGFSRGYGIDSEGSSYVTDQVSIGPSAFPDQPDGVYSPPPIEPEAEIRETNDMESLENRIRAIRTQFEIED